MRFFLGFLLLGGIGLCFAQTEAQEITPAQEIQFSGFGDVQRVIGQGDATVVGQVELGFETLLDNRVGVAGAVAYDGSVFGLGVFEIDFPLWGREEGHFRTVQTWVTSGIVVGQFDVPFGIDYRVYPSVARKLVSCPLVVEATHDCWNDYGIRGYLESDHFRLDVFGTNGFGYETVDLLGEPIDMTSKLALGGRLGWMPVVGVELGGSFAGVFNQNNDLGMVLVGGDVQVSYQRLSVKGEYIVRQTGRYGPQELTHKGLYGEGLLDFERVFLIGRYDWYLPDGGGEEWRVSSGLGYRVIAGCEVRVEYQAYLAGVPDRGYVQAVVGF